MKLFDCFIFYNEIDQLRLRMRYLEDKVDAFLVVEANQTFSGNPKPLFLSSPNAADLVNHPKLRRFVIDFPEGLDAWGREAYQRDAILQGLKELDASAEDLILVSDVDEIPSLSGILRASKALLADGPNTITIFEQRLFYFRLNYELVWSRKLPWLGTVLTRMGTLTAPNKLRMTGRNVRGRKSRGFNQKLKVLHIPDGGWHFSYLGDDAALDAKLSAYSHQEHNTPAYRARSVKTLIDSRQGLHERDGLHQVWSVIYMEQIGIDVEIIASLGLEPLIEPCPDSVRDVIARLSTHCFETRAKLGLLAIGVVQKKY